MKTHLSHLLLFVFTLALGLLTAWILTAPTPNTQDLNVSEIFPKAPPLKQASANEVPNLTKKEGESAEDSRVEYFSDARKIGRPGKNKIEIRCFSRGEGERFAEVKFYVRSEYDAWIETQSFKFEKDGLSGCDPVIADFNNDGLKDFTYRSAIAARGANEVRKLFIYDKAHDELIYIENSEDYPNLAYNRELKCIDSFMVYGATSTVFLRIEGDLLREIASVATGDELVVTVTDDTGHGQVTYRRKMNPENFEELFRRFATYDPPRE